MALLERGSLGLAVVGEDDDLVRPRRVAAGAGDAPELLVELAQGLERVGPHEARVVGDLVVAGEGRVDRRPPAHHVGEHGEDDQVADDDAHRPAHQRVDPAPMSARAHVAPGGPDRRGPLDDHLPHEQHQRPGDVEAVGEEGPVAGVGAALVVGAADREDRCLGLAREQVAATGAAVGEQAVPGRVAALDLGAIGGRGADHHPPLLLLHPAEGGDVLVRAEQDPGLAGSGLRGEVGLPLREPVAVLGDPAGEVGSAAVAHRVTEDRQREPVDLEEDDPGSVGFGLDALPPCHPPDHADGVGVVVVGAEDHLEHHGDRRDHQRGQQRVAERVDADLVDHGLGELQDQRVGDQHQQEADDEHERQPQRRQQRRDERVEDPDQPGDQERRADPAERDPGDQRGGDPDGDRPDHPGDDQVHEAKTRRGGLPAQLLAVCGVRSRSNPSSTEIRCEAHPTSKESMR